MKEKNALRIGFFVFIAMLWLLPAMARADDYVITFTDHRSGPTEIALPTNVKFAIKLQNKSEVEKLDLNGVGPRERRRETTAFNLPLVQERAYSVRR
ncbi:MAG TPA: hypothetical protein VL625_04775 [Patescibacteria group bacterium]|nr:hypothetical protein [Patescibacteria group bacterium]